MSQLKTVVMKKHHKKLNMEQVHLLLLLMVWSGESNHLMEQQVNLFKKNRFFNAMVKLFIISKFFFFIIFYQNGTSSLIVPSNGLIHQTTPLEGETSELAPYLISCDEFSL